MHLRIKLLAGAAGANAVININDVVNIKLPYLAEVNRERLEAQLGKDIRVTRTAILLPIEDNHTWTLRLLDVLKFLAEGLKEATGL